MTIPTMGWLDTIVDVNWGGRFAVLSFVANWTSHGASIPNFTVTVTKLAGTEIYGGGDPPDITVTGPYKEDHSVTQTTRITTYTYNATWDTSGGDHGVASGQNAITFEVFDTDGNYDIVTSNGAGFGVNGDYAAFQDAAAHVPGISNYQFTTTGTSGPTETTVTTVTAVRHAMLYISLPPLPCQISFTTGGSGSGGSYTWEWELLTYKKNPRKLKPGAKNTVTAEFENLSASFRSGSGVFNSTVNRTINRDLSID